MTAPSPTDLALIDPDGDFRDRLRADRDRLAYLIAMGDARAVEALVHNLAGAAGTFGYAELGALAIALDDALVDARAANVAPPGLDPLLTALDAALA